MQLRLAAVVALALAVGAAGEARANGRFPRAQRLLVHPEAPERLVLAATYGLVISTDGGATFRYVCEAAYGEPDLTVDALTAFSAEGALLAGIFSGVSRASNDVCEFERTLGRNNRESVPDFTVVPGRPGEVLALLTTLPEQGSPFTELHRSDDDARSWRRVGEPLPPSLRTPLTLESAPSNPDRVYLTGLDERDAGVLLRSDDGGKSFTTLKLPTVAGELPYLAAIDARDDARIYVRTDAWRYDAASGVALADDALLYSDDGGASFRELLRAPAKLFGFALSPDGSELLLGYGDPREAGGDRLIDASALGVYRAPAGGDSFTRVYAGSVSCLTWSDGTVYVCTHERDTGFSLGWVDSSFEGELTPLLLLGDVDGPVDCAPCTKGAACQNYWVSTCQSWGRADCSAREEPVCTAGGAPNDGTAGGATEGGAAGTTSGGAAGDAEAAPHPALTTRGGCQCQAAVGDHGAWPPWLVAAWLLTSRRSRGSWRNRKRHAMSPRWSCERNPRWRWAHR